MMIPSGMSQTSLNKFFYIVIYYAAFVNMLVKNLSDHTENVKKGSEFSAPRAIYDRMNYRIGMVAR